MQPCTNSRGWGILNDASIFTIQLLIRPKRQSTWKWRGYFWQLDNFFITITHWNQMCVCVSIMHQLEATRKANPKEYEATVYTSSYISTYRDNTREKKQWLISTISTAWPSGIPLNQDAGGTSWCWHQASSNAWSHNPDWLAMSPSPTQPPTTVPLHIDSPPGAPGPSTPPHIIFPFEFCNILKPHCGYSSGVHIPCHIKKPAFAWLCIPTIVINPPCEFGTKLSGLGVTGD